MSRKSTLLTTVAAMLCATAMPSIVSAQETRPSEARNVQIVRDEMGVPHIYADTAPALYYGAAYSSAQDRLVEGEIAIRTVLGTTAELFGPD